MTVDITVGSRLPAYATSMGRVLLAGRSDGELTSYLDQLRPAELTGKTVTDPAALRAVINKARRAGTARLPAGHLERLKITATEISTDVGWTNSG